MGAPEVEVEGEEDEVMLPQEEWRVGLDDFHAECKDVETKDGGRQMFVGPREEEGRFCLPTEWEGG